MAPSVLHCGMVEDIENRYPNEHLLEGGCDRCENLRREDIVYDGKK
jgi:hypothetical protein